MKLKPKLLPYIALGAGLIGLGLRTWLFSTGFDDRGLLSAEHPANIMIYILIAVTMLLLLLGLRPLKSTPAYGTLFPPSVPACIGSAAAAIGLLITVFFDLSRSRDAITVLSCVPGVLAAGSLALAGVCRLRQLRPRYYLHAAVTAYLMLHLVVQYRTWRIEPQLQNYFPQLLASVFLMLSAYHRTTLDAGFGNRRAYVFFNCGALFFCCLASYSEIPVFYLTMAIWVATNQCTLEQHKTIASMQLPEAVLSCINILEDNGHSAYAVGGCVRDSLLGLTPHDYDLCTSAAPEQICQLFAQHKLVRSGEKHGTIGVVIADQVYEITTFRTEGGYSDSRHPDWVKFVSSVKEDLARRDFTVNAIAYSPFRGYIDPFGGQKDLQAHILRTVGDANCRFREDALRILRGIRFAVRFQLTIEEETFNAMLRCAPLMDELARERIFSELCKLLPLVSAGDLIRFTPILTQIIPELAPAVGFRQHNPHHAYDVYTHTAQAVEAAPPDLPVRLAALLHDIGKPSTFTVDENGEGHFYGHAKVSAEIASDILLRLKAPTTLRSQVVFLIEHHMTPLEPDKKLLCRRLGKYGDAAVGQLLALQKADAIATGVDTDKASQAFSRVEMLLGQLRHEDTCLTVKDLAVNGNDLLSLGVEPGPHIGACMAFLLNLVHDEILQNTKEDLLPAAQQFFSDN